MSAMRLSDLSACFQGIIPSIITTCSADGEPNTTYASQVYYVDEQHVALSCQFFNKTKRNVMENPFASVVLQNPIDYSNYRMRLRFHHSETEGTLFETMKSRIDVIASHTGMAGVFRLVSSDVYEVVSCEPMVGFLAERDPDVDAALLAPHAGPLTELRGVQTVSANISCARTTDELMNSVLRALDELLGFSHSMILLFGDDETLDVAAARGYPDELHARSVPTGLGAIGLAARDRRMIRVTGFGSELRYGEAIRERALEKGRADELTPVAPAIGLENVQAQLALPLLAGDRLVGVLALESCDPLRFDEWDEAFLQILGNQIAMGLEQLGDAQAPADSGAPSRHFVYYRNDDCIFVDDEYLIRNVPARILWKLLRTHADEGRTEFSNRELRLDPRLGLLEIKDNLASRMSLLLKRLEEKCFGVRIVPSRRGHFELLRDVEIEMDERDSA